ncbi:MAG: asparagine synthase (glutamine-hydrolyzing) [Bacteroidales bacterium]|nr:asparagine synthase (glutamine-hydrolyzing) [Bacteroidales bacterium]MDY0140889.1 asparagine synthase (glutamine-hydrolyzing) [Bacteroidales bacterium]
MCGITGWWSKNTPIDRELFNRMRDCLTHRGPDGFGSYFSENHDIALGHRRLSFLDLGESGKQPLCNENQTIWLTINGEIYNYIELREILKAKKHIFKSETDSEVVIHAYEEWGTDMINMLEGMFAFGLWDEKNQKLFIARDKFGIKPLYYYLDANQIIFASEIKAIIENRNIKRELDITSMCDYFSYRYVPSPKTIFQNIYKIEPAHYITINNHFEIEKIEYYKFDFNDNKYSQKKLVKEVDELLRKSIETHTHSEVPIGSFLSGGFDSSAIVKYMSEIDKNINTFTIGFKDWDKSEHRFAEIVAKKYGANHTSQILDNTSLELLDDLMYYYDEPIADISIIPTYLVSKLASKSNKAVLSGEGADEIFAGYTWHREYLWEISKKELKQAKKWGWDIPENHFDVESYAKAMAMGEFDAKELKLLLNPKFHDKIPTDTNWFYKTHFDKNTPTPKRFQKMDIKCFMGELVLTKVDRASMANSLEVRVPFLNTEICEKVLNLDSKVYFDKKKQKIILNKILKKGLPKEILSRKKQGFVGPDIYYKDFEWYKQNLENCELVNHEIINKETIEKYLKEKDHWRLWKIAVFEKWFNKWVITDEI